MSKAGEEPGSRTISVAMHHSSPLGAWYARSSGTMDVFHVQSDARGRWDAERASFLTNSPHIAKRVEGCTRRTRLDSENCEGLSQEAGDVDHTAALMHVANGAHLRLDSPIARKAQPTE